MIQNSDFVKIKEELNLEILWRYKELKNIKLLYNSNIVREELKIGDNIKYVEKNTLQSKYILRSSIPMIYSHWEGFFKRSIELLNNELDKSNIDYNKLNNTLLSILAKDKHTQDYLNKKLKFSEIIIDTESNLSWKVIEKFSLRYNFNIQSFEKYKFTIKHLLAARNGVSHGENAYHFEDFSKIEDYLDAVYRLMIVMKNLLLDCLQYEKYYREAYIISA